MKYEPGTVLAGKYRVTKVLGEGGMGVVLEATQIGLDRRVAIKLMLSTDDALRAEFLERFQREARAAARLSGDHVTRIFDFGQLEGDTPYIVMEYLEGEDLRTSLSARGTLPVQEAVTWVLQACEGLAEAHAAGIVHRDIKPGNLFLARRPSGMKELKVVDFGISKLVAEGDVSMTRSTGAIGSPLYISPEQFQSAKSATHATDIWALGTVLAELLMGKPVYAASTIPEVYARIMSDPPPDIVGTRSDVPVGLQAVVHKCLQRDPSARYRTVADLAMALEPFAPSSAVAHAAATVRIIQASSLAHAGLPSVKGSLPPPAPTPRAASSFAPTVADRKIDSASAPAESMISGSRTGAAWAHDTGSLGRRRLRNIVLIAAALLAGGLVTALAVRSGSPEATVDLAKAPSPPPAPAPSATEAPSVAPAAATAPPAPAPSASASKPVKKATPEKPAKPSGGDDLLLHRR